MAKLSESDQQRVALFVDEMIRQREHRGWSQAELATRAHVSKSLIAQVETGQKAPSESLAKGLDAAFGLPGTFVHLYKAVRGNGPWPPAFGEFAVYERDAVTLMLFEHAYIPGLLQTDDYARATLSHHHSATADQVDEQAKARLDRQKVLSRETPPVVWIVMDEMVLHREIGGPEVMAAQLDRVAEIAQQPGMSVQVIPRRAGAHPGLSGMFHLAEMPNGTTILFAEDVTDGRVTDDAAMVAETMQRWRYLTSMALSAEQSLELITELAQRWKTSQANGARPLSAVPKDRA